MSTALAWAAVVGFLILEIFLMFLTFMLRPEQGSEEMFFWFLTIGVVTIVPFFAVIELVLVLPPEAVVRGAGLLVLLVPLTLHRWCGDRVEELEREARLAGEKPEESVGWVWGSLLMLVLFVGLICLVLELSQ